MNNKEKGAIRRNGYYIDYVDGYARIKLGNGDSFQTCPVTFTAHIPTKFNVEYESRWV